MIGYSSGNKYIHMATAQELEQQFKQKWLGNTRTITPSIGTTPGASTNLEAQFKQKWFGNNNQQVNVAQRKTSIDPVEALKTMPKGLTYQQARDWGRAQGFTAEDNARMKAEIEKSTYEPARPLINQYNIQPKEQEEKPIGALETVGRALASSGLQWLSIIPTAAKMAAELRPVETAREMLKPTPFGQIFNALPSGWTDKAIKAIDDKVKEIRKPLDDYIVSTSNYNIDSLKKEQEKLLTPIYDDKEGLSNLNEYIATITQGGSSLLGAVAITAITKNPTLASAFLAATESSDVYNEARNAGKSANEAMKLTLQSGAVTFALEKIGLDALVGKHGATIIGNLAKGGALKSIASGVGSEISTELLQTYWQNLVTKYGYDEGQKIFEGTWETIVGTVPTAGLVSGVNQSMLAMAKKIEADKIKAKANITEEEANSIVDAMIDIGTDMELVHRVDPEAALSGDPNRFVSVLSTIPEQVREQEKIKLLAPPSAESRTYVPPQPATTQAEFQMVDPKYTGEIKKTTKDIADLTSQLNALIQDKTPAPTNRDKIINLRSNIKFLNDKLAELRNKATIATGPARGEAFTPVTQPTVAKQPEITPAQPVSAEITPRVEATAPIVSPQAAATAEITPRVVAKPKEAKKTYYHGSDNGMLKIDKSGNINLSTEDNISNFGKPIKIDKNLKSESIATKEQLFDIVANKKEKQKYIDRGIDVLESGGHAIAINPSVFSEKTGLKLREDIYSKSIKDLRTEQINKEKVKTKPVVAEPEITREQVDNRIAELKKKSEERLAKINAERLAKQKESEKKAVAKPKERQLTATELLEQRLEKEYNGGKDLAYFYDLMESEPQNADYIQNYIARKTKEDPMFFSKAEKRMDLDDFEIIKEKQERQNFVNTKDDFKLFEYGQRLIKKYAGKVSEKYVPRKTSGAFYRDSGNIGVKSLTNIATITHEIAHAIDVQWSITENITDQNIVSDLHDIYLEYYLDKPMKSSDEKDNIKTIEGFATFVKMYAAKPQLISEKYPNLVSEIISPNGKYNNELINNLISDVKDITEKYQGLDANAKIRAIIVDKAIKGDADGKSFFNLTDKVRSHQADYQWYLEKAAVESGVINTGNDFATTLRNSQMLSNVFALNREGKNDKYEYWTIDDDGNYYKKHDFNWGSLIDKLTKNNLREQFSAYLLAKKTYYDYQNLDNLKTELETLKLSEDTDTAKVDEIKESIKIIQDKLDIEKKLTTNPINRETAEEAYILGKDKFEEYDNMYRTLQKESIEMAYKARLINKTMYDLYMKDDSYASMKRSFFDEFVNSDDSIGSIYIGNGLRVSKVSSLKKAVGSTKAIQDPVFSAIQNEGEMLRKSYRQLIYNKMANAYDNDTTGVLKGPDSLMQEIPFDTNRMNDPDVVITKSNEGKNRMFTVNKDIKKVFDLAYSSDQIGAFEKVLKLSHSAFIKGTTGWSPKFAIKNIFLDMQTSWAQSRNNMVPIIDMLQQVVKTTVNKNTDEARFTDEWYKIGGYNQTFVRMYDTDADSFTKELQKINEDKASISKLIEKGVDVISWPAQKSEALTRLTEYIKSRKNGKSQMQALEEAARVTFSFSHVGGFYKKGIGKYFKYIPYYNANIQVLDNFYMNISGKNGKDAVKRSLAVAAFNASLKIVSTAALAYAISNADDDEEKKEYEAYAAKKAELDIYNLANYTYSPKLGRIPVGNTYAMPGTILDMMLSQYILGDYGKKYKAKDYLEVTRTMIPQQFDLFDPVAAATYVLPFNLKGFLLPMFNIKDFPEIKNIESEGIKYKPSEERYYDNTNKLAVALGQTQIAKDLNLSPLKIEQIIKNFVGREGAFVSNVAAELFDGKEASKSPVKQYLEDMASTLKHRDENLRLKVINDLYKEEEKIKTALNKNKYDRNAIIKKNQYDRYFGIIKELRNASYDPNIEIPEEYYIYIKDLADAVLKEDYTKAQQEYLNLVDSGAILLINNFNRNKELKKIELEKSMRDALIENNYLSEDYLEDEE